MFGEAALEVGFGMALFGVVQEVVVRFNRFG